jgi:hypothetical protein
VFSHSGLQADHSKTVPDDIVDVTSNPKPLLGYLASPFLFHALLLKSVARFDFCLKAATYTNSDCEEAGRYQPNNDKDQDPQAPS